jgi:prepilin-type N-terminal cleavage/methylation domain-containing protein
MNRPTEISKAGDNTVSRGVWCAQARVEVAATDHALSAFSLIELLVVMAIIALLATVGLPALKGFGKGNADAAAHRQMLDDIALARLRAISGRTTVFMVFVPAGILGHVGAVSGSTLPQEQQARQMKQLTNLISGQYTAYALFARRSVGAQPGRENPRYLTEWRRLPDGILFEPGKFDTNYVNTAVFRGLGLPPDYGKGFDYASFPFPSANSPKYLLPYIAFNSLGQLVSGRDELIPLSRGSVFYPNNLPDVVIKPVNNFTNNYVRINWLTGRASMDELTRPKFN